MDFSLVARPEDVKRAQPWGGGPRGALEAMET